MSRKIKTRLKSGRGNVKFISCEVIFDEVRDRLPENWEALKGSYS